MTEENVPWLVDMTMKSGKTVVIGFRSEFGAREVLMGYMAHLSLAREGQPSNWVLIVHADRLSTDGVSQDLNGVIDLRDVSTCIIHPVEKSEL